MLRACPFAPPLDPCRQARAKRPLLLPACRHGTPCFGLRRAYPPRVAHGRGVIARAARIPENVRAVSVVSLVNDLASELAYPIVPLFLTSVLGAPVAVLGVIEGIAEGVAVGLGALSGWISDRAGGRRVPWITAGYTLTAVSRAAVAAATHWGLVLAGRLTDRTGKAVRTAPRDALIRDSTAPELVGTSFGFHRAADTVGATIGPLVAAALLAGGVSLRNVLWISVLPGLLAVLLVRRVREAPARAETLTREPHLRPGYWPVVAAAVVFSLGNSSNAFLLLRASNLGLSATLVILAYALYNLVYAGLAWPLGSLSDRIPRAAVLAGGFAVYALVYTGLALAGKSWAVWPLFALYGVYVAATDGVLKAWVADHVDGPMAGTAYGIYAGLVGAALLVASVVAGVLWETVSPAAAFWAGAALATASLPVLAFAASRPPVARS
ncbi:MAG: MFS transporter [Actinobacteria bacterium]|nr:MAG: MFS transporter [Actinomycetota bacterium]